MVLLKITVSTLKLPPLDVIRIKTIMSDKAKRESFRYKLDVAIDDYAKRENRYPRTIELTPSQFHELSKDLPALYWFECSQKAILGGAVLYYRHAHIYIVREDVLRIDETHL